MSYPEYYCQISLFFDSLGATSPLRLDLSSEGWMGLGTPLKEEGSYYQLMISECSVSERLQRAAQPGLVEERYGVQQDSERKGDNGRYALFTMILQNGTYTI